MIEKDFTIINRLGLHARAAAQLVQTANRFAAEIILQKEDLEVNGKSIMGVLMLAAAKGSSVSVRTDGQDETEAMNAVGQLINDGFGED